jgi:hypothetical protein
VRGDQRSRRDPVATAAGHRGRRRDARLVRVAARDRQPPSPPACLRCFIERVAFPNRRAYGYEWYDSPNRRFPSIVDFEDLCKKKHLAIDRRLYIDTGAGVEITDDPNLNADMAIVMISR